MSAGDPINAASSSRVTKTKTSGRRRVISQMGAGGAAGWVWWIAIVIRSDGGLYATAR